MGVQDNTAGHNGRPEVKCFVSEDGQATIVCPHCQKAKIISVEQYRGRRHKIKVRCVCTLVFVVYLEFRRAYRKPTSLPGTFRAHPPAVGGGMVTVNNISLNGICFEIKGIHNMQIGQKGLIIFTLDNKKQTQLKKNFIIRSVSGSRVGCEFKKDQAFEKELGFYLRFNN